jgi:hypothetical protein
MLIKGFPLETIQDITDIPIEDLKKMRTEIAPA